MRVEETDVLVVGAGPAGLTTAAFLARNGIQVVALNMHSGCAHTPRAHITNQRAMEVFRDLGIADRVYDRALPQRDMGQNFWGTSLAGRELARMYAWGGGPDRQGDYEMASPCPMCNIGQHDLEPVIQERAIELGTDLRLSTELLAIEQDEEKVEATVLNRVTGEQYLIRSKYAVGADGGRSLVQRTLQIPMEGEAAISLAVNIWFEADLSKYRAHRPGALFFTVQPGRDFWNGSGSFVTVRPWNEWVMVVPFDPYEEFNLDQEAILAFVRRAIGDPDIEIKIKDISQWQVNHLVASQYRKGRILIAGDAAHRHPPTSGLGSNTCVQDAFNLGWKLSLVVRGLAGEALLDTYHDERQPVGRKIVDTAMSSLVTLGELTPILGLRQGQSQDDMDAALDAFYSDTPEGRERRAKFEEKLREQDYQFNASGTELDNRYTSAAIIPDGTEPTPYARDPRLYYQPTTRPGATLPHTWVVVDQKKTSTLDLVGQDAFTVITGTGGESWVEAAATVSAELGVTIRSHVIGRGQAVDDAYGTWVGLREVGDDGALLVRPDRFVAWRAGTSVSDPTTELRTAMRQILAR